VQVLCAKPAAYAFSRVIASLLCSIKPTDPATYVAAPAILFLAALVATVGPARRAAGLNPADAMRAE